MYAFSTFAARCLYEMKNGNWEHDILPGLGTEAGKFYSPRIILRILMIIFVGKYNWSSSHELCRFFWYIFFLSKVHAEIRNWCYFIAWESGVDN